MNYLHTVLEARTQSLLEKDKMTGQLGSKIIYKSMSNGEILELIKTCGNSSRIFFPSDICNSDINCDFNGSI